jgi:hypothetical protein
MKNQYVMGIRPLFDGKQSFQLPFDGKRCGCAVGQAGSVGDPKDMCVDRESRPIKCDSKNNLGRLSSNARKRHQPGSRIGKLSAILVTDHSGHTNKMPALRIRVSNRLDEREYVFGLSTGKMRESWKRSKQSRRDLVDARIGALSR